MSRLLILGATGLVGQQVLAQALADPSVVQVVAPTRRSLAPHPKLLNPIVDFKALPQADWWAADAVVCCLGTTLKLARAQPQRFAKWTMPMCCPLRAWPARRARRPLP